MAEAGEIAKEQGLRIETVTATEDISKGQVVTLADGKVADITAGEVGPFGVAIMDIANGAAGQVAVAPTVVYIKAGAAGFSAWTHVFPSEQTGEEGMVVDAASPTFDEIVGTALEAAASGAVGKVQLGYM